MKQELIKPVVRVGNSAGVILPKEWLNGIAKIKLVEQALNLKKEILEILSPYLEKTQGIYLVGSYARGEQTERSDIDVLVITNKIRKKIETGRYSIILIPKEDLEKQLQNNALPILPMIKEAKAIINYQLINEYKEKSKLNQKNLKRRIELSKSSLSIDREMIKLDKEWPSNCSDAVAYSLILNLRTVYIIDKLRRNEKVSNKEVISLIKKVSGSLKAHEGYLRVKNNKKQEEEIPIEEADKLYHYILKRLKEIEKWLKEKKD
ncbi:MAG: nucleotidyltransferase domain-containing protein [Nanoarchaeota archaeon]|nr:nucleotidyltransferase domain-containing protein [Nanoarchaeota archaeon]MBU1051958.1 nucleotidyltransferase domain-containing protein [Nanoarchaeota archaeon]MBU1988298.1 nucleotidyltransferase domain-containing protein [Nanoarchaeota archaeon]